MTKQNKKQTTVLETFEKEWYLLNGNNNENVIQNEIQREKQSRSVIVTNISQQATKEELFELLSTYGIVLTLSIKEGTISNEAIVEFSTSQPTEKVVQLTGHQLHQKHIIVKKL